MYLKLLNTSSMRENKKEIILNGQVKNFQPEMEI